MGIIVDSRRIIFKNTDPSNDINADFKGQIYVNTTTGEIFVNIDDTTDKNLWRSQKDSKILGIRDYMNDPFNDGSCVAHYRFENNVNDELGNYDGTIHGNIQYDNGVFGKALHIDNNDNNYITTSCILEAPTSSNLQTIVGWAQVGNWLYGTDADSTGDNHVNIGAFTDGVHLYPSYYGGTNGDNEETYSITLLSGEWVHLALVKKDVKTYDCWFNGIKVISNANKEAVNSSHLNFGRNYIASGYGSCSNVTDNLRIFNRVLTSDEINMLYNERS